MVWGKLIFGFVLGSVASTMANVEALRVKFEERFFAVQAHMNDQNMPYNLQQRVVNFFQYIWRRNRSAFISFFDKLVVTWQKPPVDDCCKNINGSFF